MARRGFRPSYRDVLAQNNAADRFYAAQAGVEPRAQSVIAPVRQRAAPRQLEAPVVAAISELLAVHPKVLFAVRQNSGMASYEAKSGKYQPVFFYRILTHKDVTITDFWGILKDGRMFAVEAKAPGWYKVRSDRELRQKLFLMLVRNSGGIGIFATDVSDVAEALK